MSKETGGQAFPFTPHIESKNTEELGMSLRDYFAAKAMQGMLSNSVMWDLLNENQVKHVARDAFLVADAMLKARND